jgi:hypothetical protein
MQSDPHDARILKAFALGLAVATRGMDHLRNRVTLRSTQRSTTTRRSSGSYTAESSAPRPISTPTKSLRCGGARTSTPSGIRSACAASRRSCSTARRCQDWKSSQRRSPT